MKESDLSTKIGEAIRHRREKRKMSQEAFADSIHMHRAYYGALERGGKNLTTRTLKRVSDGLGLKMWELLKDEDL